MRNLFLVSLFSIPLFLINRYFVIATIAIIIQQLIVASSTYFMATIGEQFGKGILDNATIILFIGSLIVVYIPAYIAVISYEKGNYIAWQSYLNEFSNHYLARAVYFNHTDFKQTATALIAQESKNTINDTSDLWFDLLALLLNVIFNIGVIAIMIDVRLLWAYGAGMGLAFLFLSIINHRIDNYANADQHSKVALIGILHQAVDNIILNNCYNYAIFKQQVNASFKNASENHIKSEQLRYVSSTIAMLILMIPVLLMTFYLFHNNMNNQAVLAMLIATLPRQIQLIQMSYTLISHNVNMTIIKTRIKGLLAIFKDDDFDLTKFIQYDKITVKQTDLLFNQNNLPNKGRITLIGNNGVGKSCLLLSLKQSLTNAYYLPPKHYLFFENQNNHIGSSGQQLFRQLSELKTNLTNDINIILLDEWDAHLDKDNLMVIDEWIEHWATEKLIIEIRHRVD